MIPLTIQILFLFLAVMPPVRQLMRDAAVPAYDPLPLPADQPSRTQLFNDTMLARNRRTLVDAYLKVGQCDPKWDGPMIAFLDGIALTMSRQKNEPDSQTLLDQADRLLALGCTDPMLLYGRAFCLIGVRRSEEAITALRSVLVTFEAKPVYPYSQMVWVPMGIAKLHFNHEGTRNAEMDRLCDLTVQWLAESILQGESLPEEERVVLYLVFSNLNEWEGWGYPPSRLWLELYRKTEGAGEACRWMRNIILSDYHEATAWNARGTDYADKVSEEGWKIFGENNRKAGKLLMEAHAMHPEYPDAARRLIEVSMAGGTSDGKPPRYWFDQAVKADFEDIRPYERLGNALLPRWGGSLDEMLAFGKECLDTERYDTQVPTFYWSTLLQIVAEPVDPAKLFRVPGVYDGCKKLFEHHLDTGDAKADKWKLQYLYAAYWAGDKETAAKLARELGFKLPKMLKESSNSLAIPLERLAKELELDMATFIPEAAPTVLRVKTRFEISAPEATNVYLTGTFNRWKEPGIPMAKNSQGVWRVTLNLEPYFYAYQFIVDGQKRMDPATQETMSEQGGPTGSLRVVMAEATATPATNAPATESAAPVGQ